jgi:hypothetical protein
MPMSFNWLTWSNPIAIWWGSLVVISAANVILWLLLHSQFRKSVVKWGTGALLFEPLLLLSAAYVFGCAFRSLLPRADVERICLFDTWLSSIFIGRSVATVAEICFAIQWVVVVRELAKTTYADMARKITNAVVPLILLAECCSWYAVITTNYLGNVLENSLWTVTFLLVAIALLRLLPNFRGIVQFVLAATVAGIGGYLVFMVTVDVPMYFFRWQADLTSGREFFGLLSGLQDVATRWIVSHSIAHWHDEIPWMSLYFSIAVWTSLALGSFGLLKDRLPRYYADTSSRCWLDLHKSRLGHTKSTGELASPRQISIKSGLGTPRPG